MNFVNIILSVLIFVLGLAMVIAPTQLLGFLVIVLGAGAIVLGLYDIIKVRKIAEDSKYRLAVVIRGVVSLIIGVLAIILPIKVAQAAIGAMQIVLGIYLVLCAVVDFYLVVKLHQLSIPAKAMAGKALVCFAVGVLLFVLKAETIANVIMRIIGVVIMLGGVAFLVYTIVKKPTVVEPDSVRDADEEETTAIED